MSNSPIDRWRGALERRVSKVLIANDVVWFFAVLMLMYMFSMVSGDSYFLGVGRIEVPATLVPALSQFDSISLFEGIGSTRKLGIGDVHLIGTMFVFPSVCVGAAVRRRWALYFCILTFMMLPAYIFGLRSSPLLLGASGIAAIAGVIQFARSGNVKGIGVIAALMLVGNGANHIVSDSLPSNGMHLVKFASHSDRDPFLNELMENWGELDLQETESDVLYLLMQVAFDNQNYGGAAYIASLINPNDIQTAPFTKRRIALMEKKAAEVVLGQEASIKLLDVLFISLVGIIIVCGIIVKTAKGRIEAVNKLLVGRVRSSQAGRAT